MKNSSHLGSIALITSLWAMPALSDGVGRNAATPGGPAGTPGIVMPRESRPTPGSPAGTPGALPSIPSTGPSGSSSGLSPELHRPKDPLESFDIDELQFVGTMRKGDDLFALIRAGGTVYPVKKGNYIGRDYGVVTGISDTGVRLKELVPDTAGDWTERDRVLKMQEAPRTK